MIQQQLYEWITHPERLNRDTLYELRTLLARYPYFQTVRLLYLKNLFLLHDITFGEELRKAALYVADRKILFYLIEGERFTVSSFEKQDLPKEEAGLDRTLSLIDTFLSSLPEEPVVMELPMDVTTDYTSFLLHEEEHVSDDIPQMKGQNLIDNFIEKSAEEPLLPQLGIKEAAPVKNKVSEEEESEDNEEDMEDESYFTETLAKIYVKQQRYSKALEIIKKLNLKYPKKNAYFADQIRFLEKLIICVLADTLRVSATINALQQAIEQAVEMTGDENLTGLIHHSDRGVQYCCDPYVALLQKHGIAISMTEDYKPTDNAVAERINGIIKAESSHPRGRFNDIGHARNVIARYIHFYNHRRPHMSIGYKIPAVAHLEKGIQKKMWKKKKYPSTSSNKKKDAISLQSRTASPGEGAGQRT